MFKQEARIQKDFNKFLAGVQPNVTKSPCECIMSVRTYHKIEKKKKKKEKNHAAGPWMQRLTD